MDGSSAHLQTGTGRRSIIARWYNTLLLTRILSIERARTKWRRHRRPTRWQPVWLDTAVCSTQWRPRPAEGLRCSNANDHNGGHAKIKSKQEHNTTLKLNRLRMMLNYTSKSLMNLTLRYTNQHSTLWKAGLILGSYPFPLRSVVYKKPLTPVAVLVATAFLFMLPPEIWVSYYIRVLYFRGSMLCSPKILRCSVADG